MVEVFKEWQDCPYCDDGQMDVGDGEGGVNQVPCTWCNATGKLYWGTHELEAGLIRTYQISENTDPTEYNALSDAFKQVYRDITGMGIVDLTDGTAIRATLWLMFDDQSTTRANLITLLGE